MTEILGTEEPPIGLRNREVNVEHLASFRIFGRSQKVEGADRGDGAMLVSAANGASNAP
jgi:hypothetical protein